jgi:hypothetical protein
MKGYLLKLPDPLFKGVAAKAILTKISTTTHPDN